MNKFWMTVIVVIVVAAGVWWVRGGDINTVLAPSSSASPSATPAQTGTPARRGTPAPSRMPSATPSMSYSQLVAQYGANRIQIDSNCQAQPASVVFKNGTSILLDNRTNQTRTIGINGHTYSLGAYGYQVITLSSATLPQQLSLSCNNQPNVGTVQLQANISGQ